MNELLDVCCFNWVRTTFLLKRMHDVLSEYVNNQPTDEHSL